MRSSVAFVNAHPEFVEARDRSRVWAELLQRYAVEALGPESYVIHGDAIGDRDDLFVDVLARGSSPETSDALARQMFEELSPHLRELVLSELLQSKAQEAKWKK
jgi:hypothetical protein